MATLGGFKSSKAKEWSADLWDRLMDALDARFGPLEEQLDIQRATTDAIVRRGLSVIEELLAPQVTNAGELVDEIETKKAAALALVAAIQALLDAYNANHLSADLVDETASRLFLSPALKAAYDGYAAAIAAKATPADIAAAISALKAGVDPAFDTLVEIADRLADDDTAINGILSALGNRIRFDAAQSPTPGQQAQAIANIGLVATASQTFAKADPYSVAFTKTGNGTVSLKAGTVIGLNGLLYPFAIATAVVMPTLTAGTDYAIYLCNDGTLRADSSFTAPSGYSTSTSRKVGGFHYAPGGNATGTSGGNTTAQINEYSLWDLKWRPACPDPRGMALVANAFWVDIYLTGINHHVDGTSKYNVAIARGTTPPKIPSAFGGNGSATYSSLTWFEANEVMRAAGKNLLSVGEGSTAFYGSTENTSSGGTDVPTTGVSGTGATATWDKFTSKWGVIQATGCVWVWGRDFNYLSDGTNNTYSWHNVTGGRGQIYSNATYGISAVRLGGAWGGAAISGSRASAWIGYPWDSGDYVGARGRCDHLRLDRPAQ